MQTQIILTKILADQMQLAAVLGQVSWVDSAMEICKNALLLKNANYDLRESCSSNISDHRSP